MFLLSHFLFLLFQVYVKTTYESRQRKRLVVVCLGWGGVGVGRVGIGELPEDICIEAAL